MRVVERASRAIESAVGYENVLAVALDTVVPGLADFAVLMLGEESGGTRIEALHRRAASTSRLRNEVVAALDAVRHAATAQASAGHYSQWLPSITEASVRLVDQGDERLAGLLGGLGV